MKTAVISGIGSSLPEKVLTNQDLEKIVDTTDEWIRTRTGIRERRIAGDEPVSHYAIEASRRALADAGIGPGDLDLIIVATVTPDRLVPATACFVQHKLGAGRVAAFDIQAGCSGFLYALQVAKMGIVSGTYRNALVVGAELLSKLTNWTDRTTCVLFADGAGAAIVTAGEAPRGILSTRLYANGEMFDLITIPAGGSERPISVEGIQAREHLIRMKGNDVFKVAVRSIEEVSRQVLADEGLTPADVDLFVPHQANQRIIDAVGARLEIGADKVLANIERTGNTSAASIPIALDEARREGRLKSGQLVLLAAFGAGLTWAASLVRW